MVEAASRVIWSPLERKCLHLLQQCKFRDSLFQIHAFMLRNALETNVNLLTKFISNCSSLTDVSVPSHSISGASYPRRVFDLRPSKDDTFLSNTMIRIHVGLGEFIDSLTLYKDLLRHTLFTPNNISFTALVKVCGSSMAVREGEEVHNHVVKSGFRFDVYVSAALVEMYARFGQILRARVLFDEMDDRSEVPFTILIHGYVRNGDIVGAQNLFDEMPERDTAVFNLMIYAYTKIGDMEMSRRLFHMTRYQNVISWSTLIRGYCNSGDLDSARLLFDTMPNRNLYSWNTMIHGYCINKQPLDALGLFYRMQMCTSLEPDEVTVVSILPAIADLGALELGGWVHCFTERKKIDRETKVGTALVDMYAKCGRIEEAKGVFNRIYRKEAVCWNAIINGFALNGCGREALETFYEMMDNGFKPCEVTMIGVLSACNHCGLVEEGKRWFRAMEGLGVTRRIQHYGCMIDLLGRAGCLEEAERIIEGMPYEANKIILSTYVFACLHFKDVQRAEKFIKKAIEVDPQNDGNYVMLRNLYAMQRRWGDVEQTKGLLRVSGLRKEVAYSFIEIEGRVFEFVAGCRSRYLSDVLHVVLNMLWTHTCMERSL